jgi:hypothetical protein
MLPAGPHPGEPDPEEPISGAEVWLSDCASLHGDLVAQGEILEGEVAMAADEEGEEPKHREQDADHRAGIVSGSDSRDQPDARRPNFGEGQATSLARLRHGQRKTSEAGKLLAAVHGRFTEGFDTTDLAAAKALLKTLRVL